MVVKQKSFFITIRPPAGNNPLRNLNSSFETKILSAYKTADFFKVVSEKSGHERHLHGQVWFEEKKTKSDIKRKFTRICEKELWWSAEAKRHTINIKLCSDDVLDNYCEENDLKLAGDDESCLLSEKSPLITSGYYPTEAEQEQFIKKANAVDPKFNNWEDLWLEYEHKVDNPELEDIATFLGDMMFKSRKIQVIVDAKARQQNCKCLLAYIQKNASTKLFLTTEENNIRLQKIENLHAENI